MGNGAGGGVAAPGVAGRRFLDQPISNAAKLRIIRYVESLV